MHPVSPVHTALDPRRIIEAWRRTACPAAPVPTDMPERVDPLDGIRGVVFDIYGTLFVSAAGEIGHAGDDHAASFHEVLQRHWRGVPSRDAGAAGVVIWRAAIRRAHAAARARGTAHPEVDIRDIWLETLAALQREGKIEVAPVEAAMIERMAIAYEAAVNPVWPMPDAGAVLTTLKRRGLILGIVSNAQFFTPYLFDALLGQSLECLGFPAELCVWSYRLGEAKPSVRLFDRLLEHAATHGIRQPAELLYVGNDMLNDVVAARSAGLRTALFAGDRRSLRLRHDHPECRNPRPDAVLRSLAAIPGLVAGV